MLVVEVEGIDGALRRIELGEGSPQDAIDWRALVCDKAGVLPVTHRLPTMGKESEEDRLQLSAQRCGLPRHQALSSAFDAVLGADFADNILLRLSAHSLAKLSTASRRTREMSGRDLLWLVHLRRYFYKGSDVNIRRGGARAWAGDRDFVGYLTRMIALFRACQETSDFAAVESWTANRKVSRAYLPIKVQEGELRAIFANIMNERCKVSTAMRIASESVFILV